MPIAVAGLLLTGCSGQAPPAPTASIPPTNTTRQANIEGEWALTRTVVSSDDAQNSEHAVGAVSVRSLVFDDITCADGPCAGTVRSGPSTAISESGSFTSAGDVISYTLSGFLNCLRQDTGAVLVANGFEYSAAVTLTTVATSGADATRASTLEGTLTYTDTLTPAAIEAGCTRDPVGATTEYDLSAIRVEALPAA